jgi:outer membrane lipoprotein
MSHQARSKVTYFGTFSQLQKQPNAFLQETVMWGGKVIETRPMERATELVVLQLDLSDQQRPRDDDHSQGRYVARSKGFLDPAIYPKGTLVTVIGRFVETDQRMIGEMSYQYPVIEIDEIKKWPPSSRQSPRFHFGIGVGTHF